MVSAGGSFSFDNSAASGLPGAIALEDFAVMAAADKQLGFTKLKAQREIFRGVFKGLVAVWADHSRSVSVSQAGKYIVWSEP